MPGQKKAAPRPKQMARRRPAPGRALGRQGAQFKFPAGVANAGVAYPTRAYNPANRKKKNGENKRLMLTNGLDAFHTCHLSLPRAIAPYSVIKTTRRLTLKGDAGVAIFGPMTANKPGDRHQEWSASFGYISKDKSLDVTGANNAQVVTFDIDPAVGWAGANVAPAAFSIQVMVPSNLQNSGGLVVAGRSRMAFNLSFVTRKWGQFATSWAQYSAPRVLTGTKLAFRGVQIDALPVNMNKLADIVPVVGAVDGDTTISDSSDMFDGFAPVVIDWSAFGENTEMEILATCEWRVRFDPSNPAYAAHEFHKPAHEDIWSNAIAAMGSTVNGVKDIVETVAAAGAFAAAVGVL